MALRSAGESGSDRQPVVIMAALDSSHAVTPVEGMPSVAWFEAILAAERASMAHHLERRHQLLLMDLHAKRKTDGQVTIVEPFGKSEDTSDVLRGAKAVDDVLLVDADDMPSLASRPIGATSFVSSSKQSEKSPCQDGARSTLGCRSSGSSSSRSSSSSKDSPEVLAGSVANVSHAIDRSSKLTLQVPEARAQRKGSRQSTPSVGTESSTQSGRRLSDTLFIPEDIRQSSEALISKLARDPKFELTIACIIFANAVAMAFQIQYNGIGLGHDLKYRRYSSPSEHVWSGADVGIDILDYVFGVIYFIEFIIKVLGFGLSWFRDPWNYLDASIVCLWLIEKPFQGTFQLPTDATVLRMARLFRVLRLLKLLRTLQGFDSLYLLLTTLKGCLKVLGWSCVLLLVTQLLIAMMFWFVLMETYFGNDHFPLEERREVFEYFGTFTRTMLTMFEMTLANWPPVCRLLVENVNEWFSVFCVLYKLTMGFAVIGVINGVFMQETFKVAATDDRIMVRQRELEVITQTSKLERLFKAADASGDGFIDRDEFRLIMEDKGILMWLSSMEITVRDPDVLYSLLDADGDGELTCEELVRGAMALRGQAKSVDVLELKKQVQQLQELLTADNSMPRLPADVEKKVPVLDVSDEEPTHPFQVHFS